MSILTELLNTLPKQHQSKVFEARASHAVNAALNFTKMLKENYSEEDAEKLIKKFLLAIKNEDPKRILRTWK